MGYYANYEGIIITEFLNKKECLDFLSKAEIDIEELLDGNKRYILRNSPFGNDEDINITDESKGSKKRFYIEVYDSSRYSEDDIYKFLSNIKEYVSEGEIECRGEDGELWRFNYRDEDWYEDNGSVVYDESSYPIDPTQIISIPSTTVLQKIIHQTCNVDRCVCCGDNIPEGSQVCDLCVKSAEETK